MPARSTWLIRRGLALLTRPGPTYWPHYDKTDAWTWPTHCTVALVNGECPKGREVTFKTYPEALRSFLQENRYIAETPPH